MRFFPDKTFMPLDTIPQAEPEITIHGAKIMMCSICGDPASNQCTACNLYLCAGHASSDCSATNDKWHTLRWL